MPFVFLIVGVYLIAAGIHDSAGDLMKLLYDDLTGPHNFVYWVLAIFVLGSLGYVKDFQPFSRSLLVLVLLVLILAEDKQGSGGFFTEFESALKKITGG